MFELIAEVLYMGFIILITSLSKQPLVVFLGIIIGKLAYHSSKNKKY